MLKKNKLIYNLLISIPVICFLFFWDIKYGYFYIKFFFLTLIILLFEKVHQKKIYTHNFLKIFLILFLFITSHLLINLFLDSKIIILENVLKIIFLFLIFFIASHFYEEIIKNIYLIICLFLSLFFLSSVISIITMNRDNPFFCGGIYDYFNILSTIEGVTVIDELTTVDGSNERLKDLKLSFKEFFFQENSHLGMIAPSIIIYSIFIIFNKEKKNILFISSIILFLLICLIKSSVTLLLGTIFSLLFLIIFNFKKISKKIHAMFFIIIIIFSSILISDKECKSRFFVSDEKYNFSITNNIFTNLNEKNQVSSATFETYRKSLVILINSIYDKPFGWGFERYESAFYDFNHRNLFNQTTISEFNSKDAGNNFIKIVVEFGVFSLLFFLLLINYARSNSISLKEKCFLLPFIITQLIRGAGYFNGGFILIVFLIYFRYLNRNNLENK
jgi:hypothetical protein